jgi:hypothetical protein
MKKIIAVFVLMLGVSFTASAQKAAKPAKAATTTADTKEANIKKAAAEDTQALSAFVKLTDPQIVSFNGLFEYKYRKLAENPTEADRKSLVEIMNAKINATLTPDQVSKLSQNQKLLNQLTGKK